MRVNPHDPYSPIARLPGQTYPGDPLVKRPERHTPGEGGSGRGAFDVNGGAFDVNSKTGINPGINPKTGIPRGQGAQAFYESIEPPTDEELASLGDEVDTPWDEDDDRTPPGNSGHVVSISSLAGLVARPTSRVRREQGQLIGFTRS